MPQKKLSADLEDIENLDEIPEEEQVDFWVAKQKELITSTVDYNLSSLNELISQQKIQLSPKYQRRLRWRADKQSKLIESFLMNVPIPPVYLNEDDYGVYSVIDGKQRLTSIHRFLADELVLSGLDVFRDINGKRFRELPRELQAVIQTRPTLRAVILLRQSDKDLKNEVFSRLNTGGIHLNAQEIRNNAYPGSFNDFIMSLSEETLFHRMLGIHNKARSSMYQEMRDAELVLRYFAFKDNWEDFKGGMKRHMDNFMSENKELDPVTLRSWGRQFMDTLGTVEVCFGETPFRRWIPEKGTWRKQILASLFDAQMFACQNFQADQLRNKRDKILRDFKNLFSDAEFRKSIDAATNTPALFKARIGLVRGILGEAVR